MSQSQSSEIGTGTTASRAESADQRGGRDDSPASTTARLRRWFLQRGVLYGLTQTPMIALMVGFIFKWISYPLATVFLVLPTVFLLPAWILYRRRVSSDPDEPANQFPRLALWAVFPVIVFDLARIPMHYALGNVFWGTWFDFGSSLTGQPPSHWSSLLAGTFLHIFQGYVLALGYYILFRRASLLSALAYLFVFLSVIYSWQFPRYVILGPTPFKWYFVIWWAHLWFALAAWAVPRLDTARLRERLHRSATAWTAAVVAIALAAATFGFVFWRVDTWQFPRQDATDSGAFSQLAIAPNPGIVIMAADTSGEAEYRMTFRLGPRDYKNFMGTKENLGAGTLQITGSITDPDGPIAFCADTIPLLPSASALATPATFAADVKQMDYTSIPVTCVGPAASLAALHVGSAAAEVHYAGLPPPRSMPTGIAHRRPSPEARQRAWPSAEPHAPLDHVATGTRRRGGCHRSLHELMRSQRPRAGPQPTGTVPQPASQLRGLPLRQVADLALPDGASRFDYESIDPLGRTLYIAHLDASSIVAVNLATRQVQADLHGIAEVYGVLAVPSLGKLFASATGSGQAVMISEKTGRILAWAPAGAYPDGLAYDPVKQEIFVSDESGGVETVIDARDGQRIATVNLGGQAGNVQYDDATGNVLADVQTRNVVAVIDPASNRIVRNIALPGCAHDHGLYLDEQRHLGFVACDGNARLLVLDFTSYAVRQDLGVGEDPDVLAFDPSLRRLYVAAESGVVTIFAERGNSLVTLGQKFLATEAHTVAVDPVTHLVYFALQDVGGEPVLRIMAPVR